MSIMNEQTKEVELTQLEKALLLKEAFEEVESQTLKKLENIKQ